MADREPARAVLLPAALALVGLAFLLLAFSMMDGWKTCLLIGLPTLALQGLTPAVFRRLGLPLDRVLHALVVVLTGLGLTLIVRLQLADPALGLIAQRQLLGLVLGTFCLAGGVLFGRSVLVVCHYRYLLLCLGLLLLALTIPFGESAGGSRAWLRLGQIHVQPSEVVRPIVLFFLASHFGQYQPLLRATGSATMPLWRRSWLLGPVFAMWTLSLAVLLLQRDLGTAVLYFAALLVLLYLSSGKPSYLLGGMTLGIVGCLAAAALVPHVRARFVVWLHPLVYAAGQGFQSARGLFALASGGLLGTGLGRGLPRGTPAVHTDLIYTVIGEELGLAGALAVLLLYLALVIRGLALACRSRDRVGYLLGAGLSFSLGIQVLLIVGGTVGLLPLTGVTLPLLSYGGSSLAMTMCGLGMLSGIGMERGGRGFAD